MHGESGESKLKDLTLKKLFIILFFTLLWWVCIWTLTEELVHYISGGNKRTRIFIYIGITAGLVLLMATDPEFLQQI